MINKVNEFKQRYNSVKNLNHRLVSSSMSKQRTEKQSSTNTKRPNGSLKHECFYKTKQSIEKINWRKQTESREDESERGEKTIRKFDFTDFIEEKPGAGKNKIQRTPMRNLRFQASKKALISDKHIKLSQLSRLNHQNRSKKLFLNMVCQTQPIQTQNKKKLLYSKKQLSRDVKEEKPKSEIKFINLQDVNQEKQYFFVQKLKYHEVFFCAKCYRYIFAVERNYHYPTCQSKRQIVPEESYAFGIQRLAMIEELSRYTKTKEMETKTKMKLVKSNSYNVEDPVEVNFEYLTLNQIDVAFDFIYYTFIKEEKEKANKDFLCARVITDIDNQI